MGRRPVGSEKRSERVEVRMTPGGLKALKSVLREGETLSDLMRDTAAAEYTRRKAR